LNRSISYPTIHKDPGLESLHDNSERGSGSAVHHDDIEIQLEDALKKEQDKTDSEANNMAGLHGSRFFMNKVEEDSLGDTHDKLENIKVYDLKSAPAANEGDEKEPNIKLENQKPEYRGQVANKNLVPHPNSPLSEGTANAFEFSKIQTGAHSLSSTDSDMAKVIAAAKNDVLDSPPNLISPKAGMMPLLTVIDQSDANHQLADEMSNFILSTLLQEIKEEIPVLIPRPELMMKMHPNIKFFEKKGIKTDLFAIEKYVDEIIEEVKSNRGDFMEEIVKPLAKNPLEGLFQMQNSEIGSYEHF